ncbi:MAG: YgiQ family radical SAM protein [Fibrobacterales bacterium]
MSHRYTLESWLPITQKEVKARDWESLDVILISGDAYVDHPSFGAAVIGRLLESQGYTVGIIPQPNWQDDLRDFKKMGRPNLFFGVTAGCMDSMVNHYTAHKRKRSNDAYTPGGEAGFRPDYAAATYSQILKKLYPDVPVILGGIEASLRRVTHYDYWSDSLKPTILKESGADLLSYGMGENAILEISRLLKKGVPFDSLTTIPQTAVLVDKDAGLPKNKRWDDVELASHAECLENKKSYAANFKIVEKESNKQQARRIIQEVDSSFLLINPPYKTMNEKEIDRSFDLPYTRLPHPKYRKRGAIPAFEMIKHSINMHRGCFGGCSFCTISAHQGKMIASRSEKSIMKEVDAVTEMEDFKGYVSDLGGPSANMYKMKGIKQDICDTCAKPSCVFPKICSNLDIDHNPLVDLYGKVREHPDIKKAFVTSGIRYDLFVTDNKGVDVQKGLSKYMEDVITHHVSGRLKVAPEHTSDDVLTLMRKPSFELFKKFSKKFDTICDKAGLNQQLIPYFISSHPGSQLLDMADLALKTKELGYKLEQVQDFTPTPMTVATVIYYSGYHPYTLEPVYRAVSSNEKKDQKRFFFWYKREERKWIQRSLEKLGQKKLLNKLLSR